MFCPYEDNKMILEERSRFRMVMEKKKVILDRVLEEALLADNIEEVR